MENTPNPSRGPVQVHNDGSNEFDRDQSREAIDNVETPLLATDLPPELVPDKRFQQTVLLMSFIFIVLVDTYSFLTNSPIQEVLEDFICHNAYPDHTMNRPTVLDQRCKDPDVQKTLAMVRSWWSSVEMWVPLLVQIPYGIIADKYGRRPVLFLSFLGIFIEGTLTIAILLQPGVFSVWMTVLTALAYFIGGGPPMATAMIWTILCDTVPTKERTSAFYRLTALIIVLSAVLNPIAAWLMSMDPWLPMWIGIICMALGTVATLFVPETLTFRKKADAAHHRRRSDASENDALLPSEQPGLETRHVPRKGYAQELFLGAKKNTEHIWRFIISSNGVMLLVASCGFFYPIKIAFEAYMLQYTTKRFDWSWSTATYFFTVTKVTSFVVLLFILPIVSKLVGRSVGDHPLRRDLIVVRYSVIFVVAGCFLASVAFAPPILIMSYISYGLGVGVTAQTRALAAGVVEPHTVATLNTIISSTETMMGSIGAPAFGWLMSKGMELGGAWLGMLYVVSTVFALGMSLFLWLFRIPESFL